MNLVHVNSHVSIYTNKTFFFPFSVLLSIFQIKKCMLESRRKIYIPLTVINKLMDSQYIPNNDTYFFSMQFFFLDGIFTIHHFFQTNYIFFRNIFFQKGSFYDKSSLCKTQSCIMFDLPFKIAFTIRCIKKLKKKKPLKKVLK